MSLHALTRTYTTCVDARTITHAHELRASEIVSEQASEFPHLRNLGLSKSSPRKRKEATCYIVKKTSSLASRERSTLAGGRREVAASIPGGEAEPERVQD